MLIVSVACSKGSDAFVTPATPVPAAPAFLSVLTAADIGADGAPVGQTAVFAPEAPGIAMIARIGNVAPGAQLSVAWSFDDGSKITPLFTHTIEVASADTAFSSGVSAGNLLQGRYRIELTLGDVRQVSSFMVLAGAPVTATDPAQSRPAILFADPSAPPPPPEPPKSGDSGTIPAPTDGTGTTGSGAGGCQLALTGGDSTQATLDSTGCAGDTIAGAAGGSGGSLTVIDPNIQGDTIRRWSVDPCKVGGSDLPGSEVRYAAQVTKGNDKGLRQEITTKVAPDTLAPGITFTSTPGAGDFALPGTSIDLTAVASELGPGVGASGIAEITITDPNGKKIGGEPFASPKGCDASRLVKRASATYAVPIGAPPLIELTISAKDFAGNPSTVIARYTTVPAWNGVIFAKTTATSASFHCRQSWQATFEIVLKDGVVSGTGSAEPNAPPSCPVAGGPSILATHEEFTVTGTFADHRLALQFNPTGGQAFDTGFHVLWFPKAVTVQVPWAVGTIHSGTADVSISNSIGELAGVPATATLDGYVELLLKEP